MESQLQSMCASAVPGDTYRDLRISAHWSGQTFKHILVPVWLLTYDYFGKSYQVLVNGYTGRIAGKHPLSWVKITLAILGGLLAIGIVAAMLRHR